MAAVHYRLALRLEQSGEFVRAEHEFVAACKSKEAIEMYIHEKRWSDAQRMARAAVEVEEPTLLVQVYHAHGMVCLKENDMRAAEQWYVEGDDGRCTASGTNASSNGSCTFLARTTTARIVV